MGTTPEHGGWKETREGPGGRPIAAGIIGLLLLLLILQNTDETDVDFLFFSGVYPLWAVTGVVALLAFAAGWLVGRSRTRRRLAGRRDD